MELAAAAMSAVSTAIAGVTGAAGTAASAAGSVGSLLAAGPGMGTLSVGLPSLGGSLLSSILQGGATVAGVLGTLGAAESRASALEERAMDSDTEGQMARISGVERRDGLRRQLLERLGDQDVQAAASGVDLSFGTPALARDEAQRDAERALTMDQSSEDFRVARLTERAAAFRSQSRSTRRAGLIQAVGLGASSAASVARRG